MARTYDVRYHPLTDGSLLSKACHIFTYGEDRLAGLVVKASARERKIRGSIPACDGIFPGRVSPVS